MLRLGLILNFDAKRYLISLIGLYSKSLDCNNVKLVEWNYGGG